MATLWYSLLSTRQFLLLLLLRLPEYGHTADFWKVVLVASAKLRKTTITFVMSVRLSVRMEQLGSHWIDFHEIWYLMISRKSVVKIRVSLKSDKSKGHFTWRQVHIFIVSRSSLLRMINVSDTSSRENQKNFFFENHTIYEKMWKNIVERGKATDDNTMHSHCVLVTLGYKHTLRLHNTYCFFTATMAARTRLNVTLCVHWLSWHVSIHFKI